MNIGSHTFDEFRQLAANFHGYAAPGLLIGGYMMEKAKAALPPGTLFEAVVETSKCLPDAVQLLSVCSTGNQRLKICNLGRYALSLFDKYDGRGVRVSLDAAKMAAYPELYAWFFKKKPKREQDSARLEAEIRAAGDSICRIEPIVIDPKYIGHRHMSQIVLCPVCGEAYPADDGSVCRGCQGEAPYEAEDRPDSQNCPEGGGMAGAAEVQVVPVEEAVGRIVLHDMTRIEPGQFKGPEFRAGQRISAGDVCRLQQMGRFHVAVEAREGDNAALVHENAAAEAFAKKMAGEGITYDLPPKEGKIDFKADRDGLFCLDEHALFRFNLVPGVMAASRQDAALVTKGDRVAGTRAIPLYLQKENFEQALEALDSGPLFTVLPLRKAKAGILVTGTEVFQGLIEDSFIPVISAKVINLGGEVAATAIVPDDKKAIANALEDMLAAGVDLVITTGGLSVDPDDVTRQALLECGLENAVHGVPVLPGTMSLVGNLNRDGKKIQLLGVPACALYHRTTFLDLVLPRLLAGRDFTRLEAAAMGSGGYCLGCKICSWPKCPFGK